MYYVLVRCVYARTSSARMRVRAYACTRCDCSGQAPKRPKRVLRARAMRVRVIKPHFPEQTASFPRHAPLFPDTLTLILGPRHTWILVNFSQIMVDCTG